MSAGGLFGLSAIFFAVAVASVALYDEPALTMVCFGAQLLTFLTSTVVAAIDRAAKR